MPASVLLSVADKQARSLLSLLLKDLEFDVDACVDSKDALFQIENKAYALILIAYDPAIPDFGSLIASFRQGSPSSSIVAIVSKAELEFVVPLFSLGLKDVLLFPLHPKSTVVKLRNLAAQCGQSAGAAGGPEPAVGPGPLDQPKLRSGVTPNPFGYRPMHLVGHSSAHQRLMADLHKSRDVKSGILLEGEPGAEFELVAREMVQIIGDVLSYPVVLSGSEISLELLDSLDAHNRLMEGFALTVLILQVDQLAPPQQQALIAFLRAHQRALREHKRSLRLVMSTCGMHQPDVKSSSFHDELLFSVTLEIPVPPLRERREDIPYIVKKIIYDLTYLYPDLRTRDIDQSVFLTLANHPWPGNYEELVYVLREAIFASPSRVLKMQHVEPFLQAGYQPGSASRVSLMEQSV